MIHSVDPITTLKEKGFKITKVRESLINLLLSSNFPLTVQEILENFSVNETVNVSFPNKTTIYRELTFLLDQGLVREIDFGDGRKRYEFDLKDHHHHLVCIKCGKIEDFELEQDLHLQEKVIQQERNFKVINHSLEFFGLCGSCQRI